MKPLNEIFDVTYGNKLDLNKLNMLSRIQGGINFIGRSSQNHGVSGYVEPLVGLPPYQTGLITVALGGSLLSAFVQEAPFYTAQNVAVLRPKHPMTFQQKLYFCLAIRHNRFRYSAFGREANRTLRTLLVPEPTDFPSWVSDAAPTWLSHEFSSLRALKALSSQGTLVKSAKDRELVPISDLFEVTYGHSLELNKLKQAPDGINFISRTAKNNGVSARVAPIQDVVPMDAGKLTVALGGSVLETFVQPAPFYTGFHIFCLTPLVDMTLEQKLFYCMCIHANRYRYNYGRQANRTLKDIKIPARSAVPVWIFGSLVRVVEQIESSLNA